MHPKLRLSILTAVLAVIVASLICVWITAVQRNLTLFDKKLSFYHPMINSMAVLVCLCGGPLVWAVPCTSERKRKIQAALHGSVMVVAFLLLIIGVALMAVTKVRRKQKHMYSLHSWLGVACLVVLLGNILLGIIFEQQIIPVSAEQRRRYHPYHRKVGKAAISLAGAALLTGLSHMQDILMFLKGVKPRAIFAAAACYLGYGTAFVLALALYTVSRPRPLRDSPDEDMYVVDATRA